MSNKCSALSARMTSFATAILLLTTAASRRGGGGAVVVDAARLTSLGSVLENNLLRDENVGGNDIAPKSSEDLSSLACSVVSDSSSCSSGYNYGVDRSFPIHHRSYYDVSNDDDGDHPFDPTSKKMFYKEFIDGCREKFHPEGYRCDGSESQRVAMNLRQPAGMHNYTALGFHKTRAPASIIAPLTKFWSKKFAGYASVSSIPNETWSPGDTYTNHWSAPTKMLPLDSSLRKSIWDASKPLLEEWVGVELTPTSLYGTRLYVEGAVLAPHVDRMPLVISAVINVAQDVDEPWPLEVYGHDGNAYNVTMEPGDMIFYEGHSVIHGRPFPLEGRYYANVFIHFEPLGHTLRHEERHGEQDEESLEYLYKQAWKKLQTKCSDDEECRARVDLNVAQKVPHYIMPGSEEEKRWLQTHPKASLDLTKDSDWVKSLSAHTAASSGDIDAIIAIGKANPDLLHHKDNNGWNPLHEAVRGGHIEVVQYLIKGHGLDKNERTHSGDGGSPLWWAKKTHGTDHKMVKYLESIGAEEIPPNGHKKITNDSDR